MDESSKQGQDLTDEGCAPKARTGVLNLIRRWMPARKAEVAAGLLLALMAANLLATISRKSITNDETVMIPSGYYHLVAGNFQLVHEHPPLSKILSAVPLLFIQPDEIRPQVLAPARNASERDWAYEQSFWQDNRALFLKISFWTRVPMILLTLALGVLIFLFARELFGARAGLLAVFLFSVEPTTLAHGRVVQTDVPAAFGFLLVFYMLYRYLKGGRTWQRATYVGAAAGLAVLAKFSMLIVAPVLFTIFVTLVWREWNSESRPTLAAHACLAIAAALLVINAAYYFHSRALTIEDAQWVTASFPSMPGAVWASVRVLRHILPTEFVLGIFWQLWHSREGHPAGLLGMYAQRGWWYYFPVAFALKTTIPFLLLSLSSVGWAVYRFFKKRERRFLILLGPLALYTAFVMMSGINIGVRYFLPAFPFLFIAGGALLDSLLKSRRAPAIGFILAALLLCWVSVEAVRAYPDYMTYMNQMASARPHWYYLSDSNVEWGDDVRELAAYLRARGETRVTAVLLGGYSTLGLYGVGYVDALALPNPAQVETRYAAIGASFLNGSTVPGRAGLSEKERVNFFDAYRRLEPEAVFGGSIYLYRMHE